jgi:hypothetical protein
VYIRRVFLSCLLRAPRAAAARPPLRPSHQRIMASHLNPPWALDECVLRPRTRAASRQPDAWRSSKAPHGAHTHKVQTAKASQSTAKGVIFSNYETAPVDGNVCALPGSAPCPVMDIAACLRVLTQAPYSFRCLQLSGKRMPPPGACRRRRSRHMRLRWRSLRLRLRRGASVGSGLGAVRLFRFSG